MSMALCRFIKCTLIGEDNESIAGNNFIAPMNGTVVEVLASAGDHVKQGQAVIIIEAMKMQHTMQAPCDGVVAELFYAKGDLVDGGSELLNFVAGEDKA